MNKGSREQVQKKVENGELRRSGYLSQGIESPALL